MRTRKVTVIIFRYPEFANRALTLAQFSQIEEKLVYKEILITDKSLDELLDQYEYEVLRFTQFNDVRYLYRIIVRDPNNRISLSFHSQYV